MTSEYGWIIDIDHIPDEAAQKGSYANACGLIGPRDISDDMWNELEANFSNGKKFKIYDDDGYLYYSGRYLGPDDDRMFAPLDDFGKPNAGAVSIHYWDNEKNKYVEL